MRGVADDGQDLVISRDYIKEGMRARAKDLVTQELGLRSDLGIRQKLIGPLTDAVARSITPRRSASRASCRSS